jgi:3-oxoadipate enol-lactonase
MRVAARNRDRVDQLALLCTATQLPPASTWTDRAATARSDGLGALAGAVVERWFTPGYLAEHPEVRASAEAMIAATPAEGYAGCCEAIAELDLRGDLASIDAPTLAIAGDDDPATPPDTMQEITDGIKDSRLFVVPQAAHLDSAERHRLVTYGLLEHLEQP